MQENYEIIIVGRQTVDRETDEIKVDTFGDYVEKAGIKFISYMEYDTDAPYAGRHKIIKLEPNGVATIFNPGTPTRLVLEKGKRHNCMYDTGAGLLSLGVFTQQLKHDLSPLGGELRISYTLDINTQLSSQNEILVTLKKRSTESEN